MNSPKYVESVTSRIKRYVPHSMSLILTDVAIRLNVVTNFVLFLDSCVWSEILFNRQIKIATSNKDILIDLAGNKSKHVTYHGLVAVQNKCNFLRYVEV